MTIHLDRLHDIRDGSLADSNFQLADLNFKKLMDLVLDTGGRSVGVRFGFDTVTFTASRVSAAKTVNHGLGRTPIVVFVCGASDQGTHVVAFDAFTYTSTQFTTRGDFTDGTAPTGPSAFAWMVIG